MIYALIFLLSATNSLTFAEDSGARVFEKRSQVDPISVSSYKSVRIYRPDTKNEAPSEAHKAIDQALKREKMKEEASQPGTYNPALLLCQSLKGRLGTIYDSQENEISVCRFSDKSFYFSWDLYKLLPDS